MARKKKATTKNVAKRPAGRPALKVSKSAKLTSNDMANLLWATMKGLEDGTSDPTIANSIATQSREICRIAKVNIDFAKATGQKPANLFN